MLSLADYSFEHIFREANRCADLLVRMGAKQEQNVIFFDVAPSCILKTLEDDCRDFSMSRIVNIPS